MPAGWQFPRVDGFDQSSMQVENLQGYHGGAGHVKVNVGMVAEWIWVVLFQLKPVLGEAGMNTGCYRCDK